MTCPIKLIQYNIARGGDFSGLKDFLAEQNPDLITMQEVTGYSANTGNVAPTADTFDEITNATRLFSAGLAKSIVEPDQLGYQAVALLSCYPKAHFDEYVIGDGDLGPTEKKKLLVGQFKTVDDLESAFVVSTAHLSHTDGFTSSESRLAQVRKLLDVLLPLSQKFPLVFAADLNVIPDSTEVHLMSKYFSSVFEYDSITYRGEMQALIENIPTTSAVVDYVFINDRIDIVKREIPEVYFSDHYPLVVEFQLNK